MASESDTELTVEELRARYAAIRRRLYGVSGPTGVVPPVRLGEPLPEVKPICCTVQIRQPHHSGSQGSQDSA
jgi:hypothetical protein